MKLRKVKWNNHPILGNLELDFCESNTGTPFKNIIFAGENGTGKTTILDTLSTFLNKGTFENFEFIEYEANNQQLRAVHPEHPTRIIGAYDMIDSNGERKGMHTNRNNLNDAVDNDPRNIRYDGCIISRARADYKTKKITSTTTLELDQDKYDVDENDNFTSLKQLLVDIQNQDNADYTESNKALGPDPLSWDDFYPDSKIYRFKNSFDSFFEKVAYKNVKDVDDGKDILFEKSDKQISIDDLSTGEKQIVFRGAYILRNIQNLSNAVAMIDEPELSMHPKWERKILSYYKTLFSSNGVQDAQILYASHSDHVMIEALSHPASDLVIVLSEDNGVISSRSITSPHVLPSITAAETNYLAFDLVSSDYHIELFGYLQDKSGGLNVKETDTTIKQSSHYDPAIHDKNSTGIGTTTYDTLPTFIRNIIHHPDGIRSFTQQELRTSIELLIKLCS